MKFLLAPDKFKGSIDSISLCKLIGQEILTAYPDAEVLSFPLSDGGDGFEKLVQHYFNTEPIVALTIDPLGRSITSDANYYLWNWVADPRCYKKRGSTYFVRHWW